MLAGVPSLFCTAATRFCSPAISSSAWEVRPVNWATWRMLSNRPGKSLGLATLKTVSPRPFQRRELFGRGERASQHQVGLLSQDDLGIQLAEAAADIGHLLGRFRVIGVGVAPDHLRTGADGEQDLGVAGGERDDPLGGGRQADRATQRRRSIRSGRR